MSDFVIDFLDLLGDAVALVFQWASVLIAVSATLQVSALPVQSVDTKLLLLDLNMARLDAVFDFRHVSLLFLELANQFLQFLVEQLVLTLRVQIIDADT